jgi:predicted Zn-dependent protease
MALAIAIPVVGGLYALYVVATAGPSAVEVGNAGVALNAFYKANKEPPPSGHCRISDTRTLIKISKSPGSLALLRDVQIQHPEISYLKARALSEAKQPADADLDDALKCEGFAAAHGLKAKLLGKADKKDEAAAELQKALEAEPDWSTAHYNLGLVELSRGRVKEGVEQMKLYTEAEPDDADGFFMLGAAYEALARKGEDADAATKAKAAFCDAEKRGKTDAHARCAGP